MLELDHKMSLRLPCNVVLQELFGGQAEAFAVNPFAAIKRLFSKLQGIRPNFTWPICKASSVPVVHWTSDRSW